MAGQGSHRNTTILGFKGIYYYMVSPATVSHSEEDRKKADIICR